MNTGALEHLFDNTLDLSAWKYCGAKEDYAYDHVPIPGLRQEVYRRTISGNEVSIGVFTFRDRPAYIAWGLKSETHCGFHAPLSPDKEVLEVRPGCPDVIPKKNEMGDVIGFVLDGIEIFE